MINFDQLRPYLQLDPFLAFELPTSWRSDQSPEFGFPILDEELSLLVHEQAMTPTHTDVVEDHFRTSIPANQDFLAFFQLDHENGNSIFVHGFIDVHVLEQSIRRLQFFKLIQHELGPVVIELVVVFFLTKLAFGLGVGVGKTV